MNPLPPLPPYEGLHPSVVHFPIALLLIAPLFIAAGLLWRSQARVLFLVSTALLVLGAGAALLAASTGEAGKELAERIPAAAAVLERHEDLAELSRNLFLGLAGAAVVLSGLYWKWGARAARGLVLGVALVFLIGHAMAGVVLINAAHEGGRLVHELGVRAPLGPAGGRVPAASMPTSRDED